MRIRLASLLALPLFLALPMPRASADVEPHGGMLRYPDVSATQVVFTYAGDLWVVPREGGTATPLASPPGEERFARFSPDGKTVAFLGRYDGASDIYTLPVTGGIPKRATWHPTTEVLCDWTPDGKRLLFFASGMEGLNRQSRLYTVSPAGEMPVALPVPYGTFGTLNADGRRLLYTPETRDMRTWKRYEGGRATDLWLFDLEDLSSRRITDWLGTDTQPMWHGEVVYYLSDAGPEHRLNVWKLDLRSGGPQQVTHYADQDVRWPAMGPGAHGHGEIVFQHAASLVLLDLATEKSRELEVHIPGARPTLRPQVVDAARFIDRWGVSPSGKRAVVEARGDIWTLPAREGSPRNLTRTSGFAEREPAWSPDGRSIACFSDESGEYQLWLVPADGKGERRRLTDDLGIFCFSPTWSPDSSRIAFTDKTGAIRVHEVEAGTTKTLDRDEFPDARGANGVSWSADGRWLAYSVTGKTGRNPVVRIADVKSGEVRQVTSGFFAATSPAFDRKGDWLYYVSKQSFRPTYSDVDTSFVYAGSERLMVVPLRADQTSPFAPESDEEEPQKAEKPKEEKGEDGKEEPKADAGDATAREDDGISGTWEGKATGADPLPPGGIEFTMVLELSGDGELTGSISLLTGTANVTSGSWDPDTKRLTLELEDDQGMAWRVEAVVTGSTAKGTAEATALGLVVDFEATRKAAAGAAPSRPARGGAGRPSKPPKEVKIDFDGFEGRAIPLPVDPGGFGRLAVNAKGQLIYARTPGRRADAPPAIHLFDLEDEKHQEKTVASGAAAFQLTADGKQVLVMRGGSATLQAASAGASGKPVVTSGMDVTIEPRAEWRQVLTDAWRIERDYFYDPHMHGVDWKGVYDQYAAMLPDCVTRDDVAFLIRELISEMNVGHTYYRDVPGSDDDQRRGVGMLGADFELSQGAYRIARILEGAPWDADARGPLSQPGAGVTAGDYVLAVNGVPVDVARAPWAAFEGLAGRTITLTVSKHPQLDDEARDVVVKTLGGESSLRYRAWVEANRKYVEAHGDGRIGYVYVPNTGVDGQTELVRQLQGQIEKEALIIDERWNGGGQIPTRFIEMLNRPITNYWARRDGRDWPWPADGHQGPKCMLINGSAGSGGDAFPAYFRQAGLGKLIGMRTWGGLVGISGNPGLIDGSGVTAPTFAYYDKDGTWGIEGYGVAPDIEVVDDPTKLARGEEPQLDAAIEYLKAELRRAPYAPPARPAYPDRSGMGIPESDR